MSRSLYFRVLTFVLLVIGAVMVPVSIFSYRSIVQELESMADARLVQATRTIDVLAENAGLRDPPATSTPDVLIWRIPPQEPVLTAGMHAYEALLGFQFWNPQQQLRITSENFQQVALDSPPAGFADMQLDGHRWRVFTILEGDGDTVRVAERYDSRDALQKALVWRHMLPMVSGMLLLAALLAWAVRRALNPLSTLSQTLSARPPDASSPVELTHAPRELDPVLRSLNELLSRTGAAIERERQFAADAAHQLRTPLASALLHVDNATAATSTDERQRALDLAQTGLERLRRLVSQLLEFARWESTEHEAPRPVDLCHCASIELEEAARLAADKDIEVTLTRDAPAIQVMGWEPALHALTRNIIDNAFQYTPAGGRVEVRLGTNEFGCSLSVSDSGPGISPDDRKLVLHRYRRASADVAGHGLGLAIVHRIAQLHGATLELLDSHFERGLCVTVRFPTPPQKVTDPA